MPPVVQLCSGGHQDRAEQPRPASHRPAVSARQVEVRGRSVAGVRGNMTGVQISASKSSIRRFVITEKAPTRAFTWLKAATTAFTFKTLLRHYAKRVLTPWSLNVKLGPRRKGHKGRAGWLA